MTGLLSLAIQNTAVATVLAIFVLAVTRVWRNPPLAHLLWLLVLLKLVTPPIMSVRVFPAVSPPVSKGLAVDLSPVPQGASHLLGGSPFALQQGHDSFSKAPAPPQVASRLPAAAPVENAAFDRLSRTWNAVAPWLCSIWLGGIIVFAAAAVVRIIGFERRLRGTLPAAEPILKLAREVATILGVRRLPDLRYVESINVPMLWFAGRRPVIALPIGLMRQLDQCQTKLVLAHELAHLRRHDHWTRLFELLVSIVYWWNPLVWLVRREIHAAEELCCDAWVRSAFPNCASAYAELVFNAASLVGNMRPAFSPLPASSFLNSSKLKARIDMIVNGRFAPRASKRMLVVLAPVVALLLFSFVRAEPPKSPAANSAQPAAKCDTDFLAERFKYKVPFEIGQTQHNGGKIEIKEVWGTRPKIEVGGQYLARGKYTLPPGQKRGKLYFYVTAEGEWGRIGTADTRPANGRIG